MAPVCSLHAGIGVALIAYLLSPTILSHVTEGDAIVVTGSHTPDLANMLH
jgi:hypothetical protein